MKIQFVTLPAAAAALALAACSGGPSLPSLSTGSLAPNTAPASTAAPAGTAAVATPAQPQVKNDPTQRAFQVGSTSARAVKCGFYFDAGKMKQQFLAAEAAQGTAVGDMAKVEKIYDISFNGIARGIAEQDNYCSEAKTKEIKEDLNRHIAGDYTPRAPKQVAAKDEGGFFGGLFSGGDDVEKGPKYGSTEWWEQQREKMGR